MAHHHTTNSPSPKHQRHHITTVSEATTKAPPTTAMSNCLWGGNGEQRGKVPRREKRHSNERERAATMGQGAQETLTTSLGP